MSMDFPMDPSSSQQDLSFHPDMEPFPIGDLDLVLPPDWITATNVNDDKYVYGLKLLQLSIYCLC